jgi:hypothetical protein
MPSLCLACQWLEKLAPLKHDKQINVHRRHPNRDSLKYRVKCVRDFLDKLDQAMIANVMEYKGYKVCMEFDAEDKIIVGRVLDIDDIIVFHGESVTQFEKSFHKDFYLWPELEPGTCRLTVRILKLYTQACMT